MSIVYVLVDNTSVVGVLDNPDFISIQSREEFSNYFGKAAVTNFVDIRDSGVEWSLTLNHPDGNTTELTLLEFSINKL
jgi:hypothetical protein